MCIRDSLWTVRDLGEGNVVDGAVDVYDHCRSDGVVSSRDTRVDRVFCRRHDHFTPVSYTHLRAHETVLDLVCRLLLEKKTNKKKKKKTYIVSSQHNINLDTVPY